MQTEKKRNKNKISNYYLVTYNFLSALGWAYVLFLTIQTALSWNSKKDLLVSKNLYSSTGHLVKILLAISGLEVLHAALRLVPSNPVVVFTQVFIRFLVVWAVADQFEASTTSIAIFLLNLAWSLSEIIRYFYYVFNLLNSEPYILKWCRYNFFIFLYPIGAFAETMVISNAAWYIQPLNIRKKYSLLLPNKLNISFDLFIAFWAWILLYLPVFPFMYLHMISQRKKYLYGGSISLAKKSN